MRLCKDCPAWTSDVRDAKGKFVIIDNKVLGRCRAALPVLVTENNQVVTAFPPTLEDQWCWPGQSIDSFGIPETT